MKTAKHIAIAGLILCPAAPWTGRAGAREHIPVDQARREIIADYRNHTGETPSDYIVKRYLDQVYKDDWSLDRVQEDIESRFPARSHHQNSASSGLSKSDAYAEIRSAYKVANDGRAPSDDILRSYWTQITEHGWTMGQVIDHIQRNSPRGHASGAEAGNLNRDANWVRGQVRDIYRRETGKAPSNSEVEYYTNLVVHSRWTLAGVTSDIIAKQNRQPVHDYDANSLADMPTPVLRSRIEAVFRDEVGAAPSRDTVDEYVESVRQYGWSEAQVRRDIRRNY